MSSGEEGAPVPKKMHDGYHGWMKTIPKNSHVRHWLYIASCRREDTCKQTYMN